MFQLPSSDTSFSDLTSARTHEKHSVDRSNILPFIHDIKLRKLQSKIQRTVFRVDIDHNMRCSEDKAREEAKVEAIRQSLDSWVNDSPKAVYAPQGEPQWMYQTEFTHDQDSCNYFTLQYHKAILSLYTNVLPDLSVDDRRFTTCAQSAARICATYKRLNQMKVLSFTIIALHSCFVAGLTLVYCLWRDKRLFNFDLLEATKSCSQCLTIFGEKWPGAVRYGDIFDTLSNGVIRTIMEPGPSRSLIKDLDILTAQPLSSAATAEPSRPTDPLLGAVKDVFMDVAEDIPASQGWRLFTEMVQSDIQMPDLTSTNIPDDGSNSNHENLVAPGWDGESEFSFRNFDGAALSENPPLGAQAGWEHGFFAGYD